MKHLAIKVTNKYESEAVQKALFDMGFKGLEGKNEFISFSYSYTNMFLVPMDLIFIGKSIWFLHDVDISLSSFHEHYILVSSSDFFSTYAGHIERFPDYVKPSDSLNKENDIVDSVKMNTDIKLTPTLKIITNTIFNYYRNLGYTNWRTKVEDEIAIYSNGNVFFNGLLIEKLPVMSVEEMPDQDHGIFSKLIGKEDKMPEYKTYPNIPKKVEFEVPCKEDRKGYLELSETFLKELSKVLNKNGLDIQTNTHDFVLAEYLFSCLNNFKRTTDWVADLKSCVAKDQANLAQSEQKPEIVTTCGMCPKCEHEWNVTKQEGAKSIEAIKEKNSTEGKFKTFKETNEQCQSCSFKITCQGIAIFCREPDKCLGYLKEKDLKPKQKLTLDTFKNKKIAITVDSEAENIAIQNKLFSIGFRWQKYPQTIKENIKTLFITNGILYCCNRSKKGCKEQSEERCFSDCLEHELISGKEFLEKYCDNSEAKIELEFKVGDYLWMVSKHEIIRFKITEVTESIFGHTITGCYHSIPFTKIDKNEGILFSTPELAAKRFLELNK